MTFCAAFAIEQWNSVGKQSDQNTMNRNQSPCKGQINTYNPLIKLELFAERERDRARTFIFILTDS